MNSVVVKDQYQLSRWSALIKDCESSGIGRAEWMKANGVSRDQYYYWRRKIRDHALDVMKASFVEVPVNEKNTFTDNELTGTAAEIKIGSLSVFIQNGASKEFISNLLKAAADA